MKGKKKLYGQDLKERKKKKKNWAPADFASIAILIAKQPASTGQDKRGPFR
jgi:hypothetical protein